MLRAVGIAGLFFSCAGIGLLKSRALSLRLLALKRIGRMVQLLKNEIDCRRSSLPEAFLAIAEKMEAPYSDFAGALAGRMEAFDGESFAGIFRQEIGKNLADSGLAGEDLEGLQELGNYLGYLDKQMQLETLRLYQEELKRTEEELHAGLPIKKKLYQSLGIMGGVFLMILFL